MRTSLRSLSCSRLTVGRFHLEPGDEGLQARQPVLLVVERKGQEFVENIADLGAEPAEERRAAAVMAENTGVEIMDGQSARQMPCIA